MKKRASVLPLALLLDFWLGDPPNRWHPVAWMGRALGWAQQHAPGQNTANFHQMLFGAGVTLVGAGTAAGLGRCCMRVARTLPWLPALLLEALVLKMTLSVRGLVRAAEQIQRALQRNDLPAARHWLGWHLVSRKTQRLTEAQIVAATIESVAENTSDGVVAPLFFYSLGGVPAALAYRFVNTADAMWGYRTPTYEWLGKVPARLDDVANFIPARLTALLLIALRPMSGRAWHIWRRDASQTTSPNAGHPMSAMAGALGVRLVKEKHYVLGAELAEPQVPTIIESVQLVKKTVLVAGFLLLMVAWWQARSVVHD